VSVVGPDRIVHTFVDDTVGGIWASSSEDGVQWTTRHLVDDGGDAGYGVVNHVAKVIADSSGHLTAVWMRDYTGNPTNLPRATASTSADGITWSEPVELAGTSSYSVNVVVNSDSRVTALFELSDGTENTVQSRTIDNGGSESEELADTGANDGVNALAVLAVAGIVAAVAVRRRARF
jgi:hypothetical protein